MSILFAPKHRLFVPISVALLIAVAVGFWLANNARVYGQAAVDARIPDLRGQWQATLNGYLFTNVRDLNDTPVLLETSDDENMIEIDVQTGRAFAGSYDGGSGKITGVILADGTIRIQGATEGGGLRTFATCKLGIERGQYVMTGSLDGYDDLFPESDAIMGTVMVRYAKLN